MSSSVESLVQSGRYEVRGERIFNRATQWSASLEEVDEIMAATGKDVEEILYDLGVLRDPSHATNTVLKRPDLGGH